jgi:hypothetical protein
MVLPLPDARFDAARCWRRPCAAVDCHDPPIGRGRPREKGINLDRGLAFSQGIRGALPWIITVGSSFIGFFAGAYAAVKLGDLALK